MARKKKPSGRKIGKSRSIKELRRIVGAKKPAKVILIVCEGKKTEPLYFKDMRISLRLPSLNVQIVPDQGAPISIVNRAIEEKKYVSKGDEIWCVFDVEQLAHNSSFFEAVEKARKHKLKLAVSNPSFEYWYLLHFECTNRPFLNASEVEKQLKTYIPHYAKGTSVYTDLQSKTSDAIDNANKLRINSNDDWENFPNPSTSVDNLVISIAKISNNGFLS